ncbi:MAG: SdpI family protein [Flavobacteriaceae bacterium]|nr:SdpI family protein [Flavobacteriaceae bacterium]
MEFIGTPLFNICILCGGIFILAGIIMWYFPPKKINNLYGYRTNSSMKSQERWDFAQKYSAKESIKLGALLAIVPLILLVVDIENFAGMWIGLGLLICVCIILIFRTEKALKQHFKS